MAHERIAPNQGKMQRPMFIDQCEHTLHQIFTAFVLELPQIQSSNVPILKCVTSGAAQRTLSRDLNRKRRPPAAQDAPPSLNDFARLHLSSKSLASYQRQDSHLLWLDCLRRSKVACRCERTVVRSQKKRINKVLRSSFLEHHRTRWSSDRLAGNASTK